MFVCVGQDLYLQSISEDGIFEKHAAQNHPIPTRIVDVSWCNDNSYIAVLREKERPQILATKDKCSEEPGVRVVHVINIPDVSALSFKHNTKKHIALGTDSGDVIMYDTKARNISARHSNVSSHIKALGFTSDDLQLCAIDTRCLIVFPDINNSNSCTKFKQNSECVSLKCHPYIAERILIGHKNGTVSLWDVQNYAEMITVEILLSPVTGIATSSCGNYLIVAGNHVKICGLDLKSFTCTFQVELECENIVSCDLSSNDRFLAVGSLDGTVRIYDIKEQAKLLVNEKIHHYAISKILFENKSRNLDSCSNFSSVLKLSEPEIGIGNIVNKDVAANSSTLNSLQKHSATRTCSVDCLDKLKRSLHKVIKTEMDSLENQLNEHCSKFQKFLDNEFETIDAIIKKKWDIFNVGDMNQIMKAICPDESRSTIQ